jgi:hypothetical protein
VGSWLLARAAWPASGPRDLRVPLGRVRLRVDVESSEPASGASGPVHGFAEMPWPPEVLDPERLSDGRIDGSVATPDDFTAPETLGIRLVAVPSAPKSPGASAVASEGPAVPDAFDLVVRADRPSRVRLWRARGADEGPDVRSIDVQATVGARTAVSRRWENLETAR